MAESIPPPQNLEAELLFLASLIATPANVAEALGRAGSDDFYREGNRVIYDAIADLFHAGEPIEPLTVVDRLTKSGAIERAGGRAAVLDLMELPFIAANYRTYAEIVRDAATQRRLLQIGQQIEGLIARGEGETSEMLQSAEDLIFDLTQKRVRGDFRPAKDLVTASMERLTELSERGADIIGVPSGFLDLDRITGGFQDSNLIIVAARPSMGKTAFALGCAEHAALHAGLAVAVFSLEMSGEEVIQRLLGSSAGIDASRLRSGKLTSDDWVLLGRGIDRLADSRIYVDDSEGMSVAEMRTKARRLKLRDGLDLLIVDYIQLMEGSRLRRDENRVQEISAISRALKMLARDLNVPIICLSQLNRAPEARNDKRPLLSDLRDSGAIEQDADLVLTLYRDDYYDPDSADKGIAEINVAKHRNGPTDRVRLSFAPTYARFGNLARERDL